MKKAVLIIVNILLIVAIVAVGTSIYLYATQNVENPTATIKFQGYDEEVVIELYPEYAENTVKNFITLANNGFYNGLKIHRVEDSLIQGGDIEGTGSGSPTLRWIDTSIEEDSDDDKEYSIKGEFISNDYKNNTLKFERGVIGMARGDYTQYSSSLDEESYNSAGSQFFIATQSLSSLNGDYAGFGKVISGMDTVDAISKVETATEEETDEETGETTQTETTTPKEDVIIESITIDTHGIDFGKPETEEVFDINQWYIQQYTSSNSSSSSN
jgi:peptidyl-prolyl cis-trans isomerase B (cyclophilin B)